MIAQAVTGEPIQQLITQGILRPLDLTHTSFPTAAAPPHLPVQGYTVEGKDVLPTSVFESPAELSWSGAAGAMISTVADFAGLGAGAGDRGLAVTIHAAPAAATGPYAAASALTVPGGFR